MYKIEKNIPIPKKIRRGRTLKYPFDEMDVGDSLIGDKKIRNAAFQYGTKHSISFTSRKEGDKIRIWRIK